MQSRSARSSANQRLEIQIERLSKLGEGVGSFEGRALFVGGALPGERVAVEVDRSARVLRGNLVEVLDPSPARKPSFCEISDRCGGCDWIHLADAEQREAKQEIVLSALEHIGRVGRGRIQVLPPRSAGSTVGYRRRAALHWGPEGLGYFGRRSHRRVAVKRCPILLPALEQLPGGLSEALAGCDKDLLEVRLLAAGDAVAIAWFLKAVVRPKHREICERLIRSKQVAGAVLVPSAGAAELLGDPVLRSEAPSAPGVRLCERPDAFSQANGQANQALVEAALALLAPRPSDKALELYCGNGNFTFGLARKVNSVVAIESAHVALGLARRSAEEGGISHIRFIEGDAAEVCEGLAREGAGFDVILADPPRAGAHKLGTWAKRLGARALVYVACDPVALARDARELERCGFAARALQVVDAFPQTHHVEAAMSFSREPQRGGA